MSWLNAHESFFLEFAARDRLHDLLSAIETASASSVGIRETFDDRGRNFCGFILIPATKGGEV